MVDDNFHWMDEDERYTHGEFASAEEAVQACTKIVDACLVSDIRPGIPAQELWDQYVSFGDDPFRCIDAPPVRFSAWDYARQQCLKAGTGAIGEP